MYLSLVQKLVAEYHVVDYPSFVEVVIYLLS